jgi:regulator of cell morphogenesis and NO signaling
MAINPKAPLKDLALSNAGARVLEHYHLDYCCGGRQTLAEACKAAGHDLQGVSAALEQALAATSTEPTAPSESLAELIGFIVDTHHAYTRAELPRIQGLIDRIAERHGAKHPELKAVQDCFLALSAELVPHLLKEEQILFPYIRDSESYSRGELPSPPHACFGTIENPLRQMTLEHETAGDLLKRLRRLTADFTVPDDGCASYRSTYRAMEDLERDLMRHIHLENNILFPRARTLARQAA